MSIRNYIDEEKLEKVKIEQSVSDIRQVLICIKEIIKKAKNKKLINIKFNIEFNIVL